MFLLERLEGSWPVVRRLRPLPLFDAGRVALAAAFVFCASILAVFGLFLVSILVCVHRFLVLIDFFCLALFCAHRSQLPESTLKVDSSNLLAQIFLVPMHRVVTTKLVTRFCERAYLMKIKRPV